MSSVDASIALPENETPGELMKGYFTLMRVFGWDLYVTAHLALKETLGKNWFAARISELKRSDPRNWNPNHRFEPQDPGVVLRDYVHERDSPYLGVFGGQYDRITTARKILATRNSWFHFGEDPTTAQLADAARMVRGFVGSAGLHIAPRIDRLIARLNDLSTERYSQATPTQETTPSPDVEPASPIETPSDLARPPIGGTWVGDIPMMRYRITRTGDVIHPDTLESVRTGVTGDFEEKVRAWTAIEPRGREVWIDTDGAVGGYIGASPRLLGYIGPDPDLDVARGFFTPRYYGVEGDDVVDLDSRERRPAPFARALPDGAMLRVTTYGDVLRVDEAEGAERVGIVKPNEWFPGHLG